jgi:TetR/AcrR family transcriptional regulator, transcriptional repressor for nem operon
VPQPGPARERLLIAAKRLFYYQGIAATTIANVAAAAGVPLGNVYYYFRSKEALVSAVIVARRQEVLDELARATCEPDPLVRLRRIVHDAPASRELLTAHGCPYMALAQGLRDTGGVLASEASAILRLYLEFAQAQFALLNKQNSYDLANDFIGRIYGAYTIAGATGDRVFLDHQLDRIQLWLSEAADN